MVCYPRFIGDQRLSWYTIFEWLSIVHGIRVDEVKKRLNVLKKRALLEELGDGRGQLGMHDLWREFAIMETKRGEEEELQWVHEKYVVEALQWVYDEFVASSEGRAKSRMSCGGWKKLRRIFIQQSSLQSINFSKCSNVSVLRLINVDVENGALDLSHLKSIKSLEIAYYRDPELIEEEDKQHTKVSGIGQLLNLASLIWLNINGDSMSGVEEISRLTNLQVLHLSWDYDSHCTSLMSLDLQVLRYLQDVRIGIPGLVSISGFSSRMKGLRILDLGGCHDLRSCVGVGDVDGLEVLLLTECSELEELPNLQKLIRLRILNILYCWFQKALRGLGSLVALQALYIGHGCLVMTELRSMSNFAKLEVLDLRMCSELKCIPGLGNLVALREFRVSCGCLHGLPDLRNLTKLPTVEICGWNSDECTAGCEVSENVLNLAMFESVSTLKIVEVDHELSNLSKLTALKSLELFRCTFESLPHMGSDMILESLTIDSCERLRGWDDMRELEACPDFQVDTSSDWTLPYFGRILVYVCKSLELPDLCHFPQLWSLSLRDSRSAVFCHAIHVHLKVLSIQRSEIKELHDLGNFPSLRSVEIVDCNNWTNLAISKPLSVLWWVALSGCKNLRTIPNIDLFPRLAKFSFQQCGVQLNGHDVQKLKTKGFGDDGSGVFRQELSGDVALPPASQLNWQADEHTAVDAPNNLDASPSRLEPCTSEFTPYNESLSEFGKFSVPKRALELGSSSGSDQEQTKKLKNMK